MDAHGESQGASIVARADADYRARFREYRSRVVREPRAVLAEFGLELSDEVEVRVHDSNADLRYLVIPRRPDGTEGWSETDLARLVTRDSMIGTGLALSAQSLLT